jgi:hypothetical protein
MEGNNRNGRHSKKEQISLFFHLKLLFSLLCFVTRRLVSSSDQQVRIFLKRTLEGEVKETGSYVECLVLVPTH